MFLFAETFRMSKQMMEIKDFFEKSLSKKVDENFVWKNVEM